ERFHRTLHDVLAKRLQDGQDTWDLHLNQVLAAIRFNVSEATGFTPYYLLYGRDVVLPIDNLLKPRLRYQGEDLHLLALQEQHKAFMLVHGRVRKQQRKQAKYANRKRKDITYKVGEPVYYKKHVRSKLEGRWQPFYRIIEQKSPVTYVLRNQLNGKTVESHADDIKLAKVDDWSIPKTELGQPRRKANFVAPPISDLSSSEYESESENAQEKFVRRARHERDNSDSENEVPKMELSKRIRERELRERDEQANASEEMLSDSNVSSDATIDYDIHGSMVIDQVQTFKAKKNKQSKSTKAQTASKKQKDKLKTLLSAIAGVI
ncbi:MAG: hypothetical protein ABW072_13265, partial [Sedimenticola sp.]